MAITPDEAKKLTPEQLNEVKKIEDEIDEGLREEKREFKIETKSEKVRNKVLEIYRSNGWIVSYSSMANNVYILKFEERTKSYTSWDR